jgi:hypothetical protein
MAELKFSVGTQTTVLRYEGVTNGGSKERRVINGIMIITKMRFS